MGHLWYCTCFLPPPGGNKHQVEPQSPVGAAAKLAGERVRRNRDGGTVMGDGRHDLHDLHDPFKMHVLWILDSCVILSILLAFFTETLHG